MLESVLYNLSLSKYLITIFFILLFLLGCAFFTLIRKFNFKDGKVRIYGLFLNMRNKNILILSIIIVRAFVIIFSVLYCYENVNLYLTMIIVISIIYIIVTFKDIIYEIINSSSIVALVYFTSTLNNYLYDVENSSSVQIIKMTLIAFAILYTIYISLKGFETITAEFDDIIE